MANYSDRIGLQDPHRGAFSVEPLTPEPFTITTAYLEAITAVRYEISCARERGNPDILRALLEHERDLLRDLAEVPMPDVELPRVAIP